MGSYFPKVYGILQPKSTLAYFLKTSDYQSKLKIKDGEKIKIKSSFKSSESNFKTGAQFSIDLKNYSHKENIYSTFSNENILIKLLCQKTFKGEFTLNPCTILKFCDVLSFGVKSKIGLNSKSLLNNEFFLNFFQKDFFCLGSSLNLKDKPQKLMVYNEIKPSDSLKVASYWTYDFNSSTNLIDICINQIIKKTNLFKMKLNSLGILGIGLKVKKESMSGCISTELDGKKIASTNSIPQRIGLRFKINI